MCELGLNDHVWDLPPTMANITLMHSLATLNDFGKANWQHKCDINFIPNI